MRADSVVFAPYLLRVVEACIDEWRSHKDALSRGLSDGDWMIVDHAFMGLDRVAATAATALGRALPVVDMTDFAETEANLDRAFSLVCELFPVDLIESPAEIAARSSTP